MRYFLRSGAPTITVRCIVFYDELRRHICMTSNPCLTGSRNARLRYLVSKPILLFIAGLLMAASASAGPAMSFDQPDTTFASNIAIDILRFDNAIWMATSNGLNYSRDSGAPGFCTTAATVWSLATSRR